MFQICLVSRLQNLRRPFVTYVARSKSLTTWQCSQTGQYSTQIFSLAVLLSSLFIYNQMGGIDEAALDRLSLVTEMTKHIRVRSEGAAGRCLCMTDTDKHMMLCWIGCPCSAWSSCTLPHHCSSHMMVLGSCQLHCH